jgi:hypothetical protein
LRFYSELEPITSLPFLDIGNRGNDLIQSNCETELSARLDWPRNFPDRGIIVGESFERAKELQKQRKALYILRVAGISPNVSILDAESPSAQNSQRFLAVPRKWLTH